MKVCVRPPSFCFAFFFVFSFYLCLRLQPCFQARPCFGNFVNSHLGIQNKQKVNSFVPLKVFY